MNESQRSGRAGQPAHAPGEAAGQTSQALSASAVSAVRCAIQAHLDGRVRPEGMRAALRALCAEGRRRGLRAEQVVVALKGAWASLPEVRRAAHDAQRAAVEWLVTACIEEYYGSSHRRTPERHTGAS